MKSGSCVRAAVLAAAVVTFAAPAMAQAAKLTEAQQTEIFCATSALLAADDAAYDVVESYLYNDDSEQNKRAEAALKQATETCAETYDWAPSRRKRNEEISLFALVGEYLTSELYSAGLSEEQVGLIYTVLNKLPAEDVGRFFDDAWFDDAEFTKRLNAALLAAKYPGGDEENLENARLIMEANVLLTALVENWIRQQGGKQ